MTDRYIDWSKRNLNIRIIKKNNNKENDVVVAKINVDLLRQLRKKQVTLVTAKLTCKVVVYGCCLFVVVVAVISVFYCCEGV